MNEDVQYALGRMEAKLDMLLKAREEDRASHLLLEQRVSNLEQWRWAMMGGASALGTLVSLLVNKML